MKSKDEFLREKIQIDPSEIITENTLEAYYFFTEYLKSKDDDSLKRFISAYGKLNKNEMIKVIELVKVNSNNEETQKRKSK